MTDNDKLRKKLKAIKEVCLECCGRNVNKVFNCKDDKCKKWVDHKFFLATEAPCAGCK